MEILPEKVFKCLAKELAVERKKQSMYYTHLFRQDRIVFPGTMTHSERLANVVQQISEATCNIGGYRLKQIIQLNRPLTDLESFYDLLAAIGRAFFLKIKIENNGKSLQEIEYETSEIGFEKPLREFVIGLKDKTSIRECYMGRQILPPIHDAANPPAGTSSSKAHASRGTMHEDATFGETLAKSGEKTLPLHSNSRNKKPIVPHALSESSSSEEECEKVTCDSPTSIGEQRQGKMLAAFHPLAHLRTAAQTRKKPRLCCCSQMS